MFVSDAFAQSTGGAAASGGPLAQFFAGPMSFPLMMALMFGIMYFIAIRPQQQERKKLEQAIAALKKGDKVVTTGGMRATVVGIDGNWATLKIADDVRVEFLKSAIASIETTEGK